MSARPKSRASVQPIVLGRGTFLYVVVTLVLVATLVVSALLHPAAYHQWCLRYYIPSVQDRFGFRAAPVSISGSEQRRLGIVDVTPGGVFSRAGFRPGDIPVDYHGGETAFCSVLQAAEDRAARRYRKIDVINLSQWDVGWEARRELEIPDVLK